MAMVKTPPRQRPQNNLPRGKIVLQPFEVVLRCVKAVREELAELFDVHNPDSEYYRYAGLCDRSIEYLKTRLDEYAGFELTVIHCELSHSIHIDPQHWPMQHTVCRIEHPFHAPIYVDPTIDQFQGLFVFDGVFPVNFWNLQEYGYVSTKSFSYLYKDSDNIAFSDLGMWLDENVKIHMLIKGWDSPIQVGLITFIQYELWGGIAKLIRKIFKIGKE